MDKILEAINPILPIVGIVVGAAIQSFYSRRAENKKQSLTEKITAYTDYLHCVSQSTSNNQTKRERNELLQDIAHAKTRICVYGSDEVIAALAEFEFAGAVINTEKSARVFTNLCIKMREDVIQKKNKAEIKELESILVGLQPSWKHKQ